MKALFVQSFVAFLLLLWTNESLGDKDVSSGNLSSRKNKVVLNELTDVKDWKKLIKSKTNVLICFAYDKTSMGSDDVRNVLKGAAELVKGLGTIVTVDCSGEGKKLCKKVKVTPPAGKYVMKHYHNGEFNKDYDRATKVSSVVNFMKDPTGDLPWDEDESAQDVVHLPDLPALLKLIKKESGSGKGILVMFYAPWCGFCKRMKPDYVAAAKELQEDGIIAAMDVNKPENGAARQKYNITGFPTILYFRNGHQKQQYEGENNKEGIVSFMRNPDAPPVEKPKEAEWSDEPSEVIHLTSETFDTFIKDNPSVLVMFYAPWCGHCKQMKPKYVSAAEKMKVNKIPGALAAVDATKENALGSRFDVKGYPTIKYFKDGELAFDVGNVRDEESIIKFMKDPQEPPPPPPPEKPWSDEESSVAHLNEDNFKTVLRKKKRALVMFYAPWCGHCKSAKPEFTEAANQLQDDPRILYGAVDCTIEKAVCEVYKVRGFPTFKIFHYYNKQDVEDFNGERTKAGFLEAMKPGSGGSNVKASETPPEDDWSEYKGFEKVHMLTDKTTDEFLKSHPSALVMFYAPWCPHCKTAKPDYSEAAAALDKEQSTGVLAAVDCTRFYAICQKFKVTGYPTIQYFKNGLFDKDYNENRKAPDLVQFMKQAYAVKQEL